MALLSDLPSLISLPSDPNDIVVSVRGFASVDADSVSVDIDTYASPSTASPASIDTIVAGLRRLPLHATIDESPGVLISFQRDLTHVGHAQMDITAPPRDLSVVRRVVDEAARGSGLKAEIDRSAVADSCETLEARALEDAIARARVYLAKRGYVAHAVRLVYAVEGGLVVDDGRCGPELDGFPFVGDFTDSNTPIPDAAASGSVAVILVDSPVQAPRPRAPSVSRPAVPKLSVDPSAAVRFLTLLVDYSNLVCKCCISLSLL